MRKSDVASHTTWPEMEFYIPGWPKNVCNSQWRYITILDGYHGICACTCIISSTSVLWHRSCMPRSSTTKTHISATKQEVEPGSGNTCWAETDGEVILTATPTFSTMPDIDMALPKRSDISQHQKLICRPRNRKWKPEVKITFERKHMAKRFQRLPPYFRLCPTRI